MYGDGEMNEVMYFAYQIKSLPSLYWTSMYYLPLSFVTVQNVYDLLYCVWTYRVLENADDPLNADCLDAFLLALDHSLILLYKDDISTY